ncbi:protein CANDIDATE G-PROTEIN COUPLED RECEPTOR 7-like [Magnolia sinica]|uniref:protein CANDIDATE G-PROTEIN COUPLED RECEPTOR 7-like n=1 Tax=Magnolia sinica TaxID=86752 RepID=UPI0026585D7C|nr:protein CANDIDATE G-PROTEIN COUPLED RECEPTOR 7-like [Magnolia sinica]
MGNLHPPFLYLLYVLTLLSIMPIAFSEIKDTRIVADSRPMILFERFGFSNDGHIDIWLKRVAWKPKQQSPDMDPTKMGFILLREASYAKILNESEYADHFCVVSSHYVKQIFTFQDLRFDYTYNGSIAVDDPDEYSLVFGNCQPEFEIWMDVHTEMYNVEKGWKDFLPAGQTQLPKLYFIFFLMYSVFFLIWIYTCIKQRATLDKIHVLMGALLLFKALLMICASEDQSYVKRTGSSRGWDIAFYIFSFFKGIMLFTVIILIGTGWSFVKPFLHEREKNLLMIVIPLQVLENIASVVIGETGPSTKDWLTWNQLFLLIDIICCCTVFFPIIWSIRSLREASKTDGKAARNLEKLTLFKQFYVVVVGYLYFTRIVVSAIGAVVSYRYHWISTASMEGASLIFYMYLFYNFQPIERNPYFVIQDEEEAAAALALEEDNSFEL